MSTQQAILKEQALLLLVNLYSCGIQPHVHKLTVESVGGSGLLLISRTSTLETLLSNSLYLFTQ